MEVMQSQVTDKMGKTIRVHAWGVAEGKNTIEKQTIELRHKNTGRVIYEDIRITKK